MKRTISNPYKVQHKMYLLIIGLSLTALILSLIIPACKTAPIDISLEVLKNLSYGCIASTTVAWILDHVNIKSANRKANETYDAIYADLKVNIAFFIGTWAELCAVSFKEKDYYAEFHSWKKWYSIVKENYDNLTLERQKDLLGFFRNRLLQSTQYVNRSIEKIASQTYILSINDVMDSNLRSIISDFRFEFNALDSTLSYDNYDKYFWDHMEAIVNDLSNYIEAWVDIDCYNQIEFKPYYFFDFLKK
jgi:hypothetical protein